MSSVDYFEKSSRVDIGIPDVNARFGLRTGCMVRQCIDSAYEIGRLHMQSATLRKTLGMVTAAVYMRLEKTSVKVAVGQPLELRHRVRFGVRTGTGKTGARGILRESQTELWTPEGVGDVARVRETVSPEPRLVGRLHFVTADIRPFAPAGDRMMMELPAELRHFVVHDLGEAYPETATLLHPEDGATRVEMPSREEAWPLEGTDANGVVFTGYYVSEFEAQHARCLARAKPTVHALPTASIEVLFKRPFWPNEHYVTKALLALGSSEATSHVAFYEEQQASSPPRPGVIGRIRAPLGA